MKTDGRAKGPVTIRLLTSVSLGLLVSALVLGYAGIILPQLMYLMLGLSWMGVLAGSTLWLSFRKVCKTCRQTWFCQSIEEVLSHFDRNPELCPECNLKVTAILEEDGYRDQKWARAP